MSLFKSLFCVILILLALAGCNTADKKVDGITEQAASEQVASEQAVSTGTDASTSGYNEDPELNSTEIKGLSANDGSLMEGSLMGSNAELMKGEFADPKHPLSTQIIYFLYDSSQVRPEFVEVIAAHSQYLADHPKQRVILEGHADERGSPEYNIALGEQRAKAVSRTMQRQGVLTQQIKWMSYGEEKPIAFEHDNVAWQLNRRVEIVYQVRQ